MKIIFDNLKLQLSTLAFILFCVSFHVHSTNEVFAVIDLPHFGCQPSSEIECINTEFTQIVVDVIDDGTGSIQAFPYPRALNMFENNQTSILVALSNKRLMKKAKNVIELFIADFYLVSMEINRPLGGKTISYLRGADSQREIASSVHATQFEVNDYSQFDAMLKANRLDYVIIPRYLYEQDKNSVFRNARILSKHSLPILLYLNDKASVHIEQIKEALAMHSLSNSVRYEKIFMK